jgi:hypothetical protein
MLPLLRICISTDNGRFSGTSNLRSLEPTSFPRAIWRLGLSAIDTRHECLAILVRWHAPAWAPEISVRHSEHVNLHRSSTHADGWDHRPAHATEPASSHERPARSRPAPRAAALTFGRLPHKRPRPLLLRSPAAHVLHRQGVTVRTAPRGGYRVPLSDGGFRSVITRRRRES